MTVDHIGKHSMPGNLCLPLLEKSGKSQGISCGLESGHPALAFVVIFSSFYELIQSLGVRRLSVRPSVCL